MKRKAAAKESYVSGSEEYIARIRGKYDLLSGSERQVADFFLNRTTDFSAIMNIKDIARLSGTSVATVVRFCKSLGFSGFSEFKYLAVSGYLSPIGGTVRIGSRDDMGIIKQKVTEFARQKLSASINYADGNELERAVGALEKCKRMVICATGTASGVAMVVSNAFMAIGLPCLYVADSLTMLRTVSFCGADDVVVGITSCGYIKDVVDALKIARDRGAVTIGVTGMKDALVTRYSDIVLYSILRDSSIALDLITVSMCQLLALQALQVGYLSRRSDAAAEKIGVHFSLAEMSRYALDLDCVETRRVRF